MSECTFVCAKALKVGCELLTVFGQWQLIHNQDRSYCVCLNICGHGLMLYLRAALKAVAELLLVHLPSVN